MRRRHAAFTLIELMIVIAIIAVLAAILIPNFLHAQAESQTAACEGNEKQIATALEEYAVDHAGAYPNGFGSGQLTTPYLNFTPVDPAGGTYTITNTSGTYGSYEITDGDQHAPTTTGALHVSGGAALCSSTTCNGIGYYQNGGIVGLP